MLPIPVSFFWFHGPHCPIFPDNKIIAKRAHHSFHFHAIIPYKVYFFYCPTHLAHSCISEVLLIFYDFSFTFLNFQWGLVREIIDYSSIRWSFGPWFRSFDKCSYSGALGCVSWSIDCFWCDRRFGRWAVSSHKPYSGLGVSSSIN